MMLSNGRSSPELQLPEAQEKDVRLTFKAGE